MVDDRRAEKSEIAVSGAFFETLTSVLMEQRDDFLKNSEISPQVINGLYAKYTKAILDVFDK